MKKKLIYSCKIILKSYIRALLLSIMIFLPIFLISLWILGDAHEQISTLLVCLICMVTYFISFNSVREKERYEIFSASDKFSIVDECKSYFVAEGKYILLIYSVMAVLSEIYSLITSNSPQNPIAFVCAWCLPFYSIIKIPIVRSIVGILLTMAIHFTIVVFNSRKISKTTKSVDL